MADKRKKVLVLASGDAEGGGSGFQELVEFTHTDLPVLDADIVGVVSNHRNGGVSKRAHNLKVPFVFQTGEFSKKVYQELVKEFKADYVMCSGWLKLVKGLDSAKTINIHPGPLPDFGGPGMYGHHVHDAVMKAYHKGKVKQSAVSMHFVTDKYDRGPVFFSLPVIIRPDDTAETLAARVNEKERAWQAYMLNLVVHEYIVFHNGKVHYRDNNPKQLFF